MLYNFFYMLYLIEIIQEGKFSRTIGAETLFAKQSTLKEMLSVLLIQPLYFKDKKTKGLP